MKKVVIKVSAGIVGTNYTYFYEVPEDVIGTEEFNDFCWQKGVEWAESFGVYAEDADTFPDIEVEEESWFSSQYASGIEGYYEIYDAEEHDGYRVGDDNTWEQY